MAGVVFRNQRELDELCFSVYFLKELLHDRRQQVRIFLKYETYMFRAQVHRTDNWWRRQDSLTERRDIAQLQWFIDISTLPWKTTDRIIQSKCHMVMATKATASECFRPFQERLSSDAKLLQNELNRDVEPFITHESNLSCTNQIVADNKKLLQKLVNRSAFCNKICICCALFLAQDKLVL